MKFNSKLVTLFCIFLFGFLLVGSNALVHEPGKGKAPGKGATHLPTAGPSSQSGGMTSSGPSGPNKDEGAEGIQAIEELKTLTGDLTRKSSTNRNLVIGTAIANAALLLLVSGLLGFGLKGKDNSSGGKPKEEGTTGGEGAGASGQQGAAPAAAPAPAE